MSGNNKTDEKPSRRSLSAWTPRMIKARVERRTVEEFREVVMSKELANDTSVVKGQLRVFEGDRHTLERFCRQHEELRRQWYKCASYLDNGYQVLLAELDGRVVGHIWWHDHRLDPRNVHPHLVRYGLDLEPGQAWGFDLYLLPDSRGRGTSNDFFALFRRTLRDKGFTRVYGHVDAKNLPAVWLHKLQGYKKVKTVEGRLYCKCVLWSDGRLLVRNPPVVVRQRFDFRPLW